MIFWLLQNWFLRQNWNLNYFTHQRHRFFNDAFRQLMHLANTKSEFPVFYMQQEKSDDILVSSHTCSFGRTGNSTISRTKYNGFSNDAFWQLVHLASMISEFSVQHMQQQKVMISFLVHKFVPQELNYFNYQLYGFFNDTFRQLMHLASMISEFPVRHMQQQKSDDILVSSNTCSLGSTANSTISLTKYNGFYNAALGHPCI